MANQRINIKIAAVDTTRAAFRGVTASIATVTGAVLSLRAAIVGAVGVGGIGLLVGSSLRATDSLAKTSSKLGVTTKELGALRYAAGLSGVSIQTTDMAVQRFTRRLAEAAQGTGEAKNALKELNINASELTKQPLEQQMLALSEAFSKVENSSDRVRLAFKLFDSEGVSFVNILNQGTDGLRQMFGEADRLGALLSGNAARGVERANDAFARLLTLFRGIVDQTVAALAPALETLSKNITDNLLTTIEAANGSVQAFGEVAAKAILRGVANILRAIKGAVEGFQSLINAVAYAYNGIQRMVGSTDRMEFSLDNMVGGLESAIGSVEMLGLSIGQTVATVDSMNNSVAQTPTFFSRLKDAMKNVGNEGENIQKVFDNQVQKAFDGTTQALANIVTGAASAKDAFKDMARSIVNDLIKMSIQQTITKPLFGAISAALPGKAIGGSVQSGQPYMVGERGPEMFIPNQQGSIVPNGKLGGGSGVVVNQSINISTGVQQTVRTEIATLMPQIANAAKSAVLDARRRGGSFAGAFG